MQVFKAISRAAGYSERCLCRGWDGTSDDLGLDLSNDARVSNTYLPRESKENHREKAKKQPF